MRKLKNWLLSGTSKPAVAVNGCPVAPEPEENSPYQIVADKGARQ